MDALYDELQHFISIMGMFNESMAQKWDGLQTAYKDADTVWAEGSDATRRVFEAQWREMGDALRIYREQHSDAYLSFLMDRKQALDEYFGG